MIVRNGWEMNYPTKGELELEKATHRLRMARLEYEYAESIFRIRERIELWLAVHHLGRVAERAARQEKAGR